MERIKIKCPICGKEEFVEIEKPYSEGLDTYIKDNTNYFLCLNCGLVLRFYKKEAERILHGEFLETEKGKKWDELNNQLPSLSKKLSMLNKEKGNLQKELEDDNRTIARDKKIREDLKEIDVEIKEVEKRIRIIKKEMDELQK